MQKLRNAASGADFLEFYETEEGGHFTTYHVGPEKYCFKVKLFIDKAFYRGSV